MILETEYLLALGQRNQDAFEKWVELVEAGETQWLSVPVIQALEYGVAFTKSDAEKRRVRNVSQLYLPVDIDLGIARRAGQLLARADQEHGGEIGASGIDSTDPLVATVADIFDDAVLTVTVEEFRCSASLSNRIYC